MSKIGMLFFTIAKCVSVLYFALSLFFVPWLMPHVHVSVEYLQFSQVICLVVIVSIVLAAICMVFSPADDPQDSPHHPDVA